MALWRDPAGHLNFEITLHRPPGARLGLKILVLRFSSEHGGGVLVDDVRHDGVVAAWNRRSEENFMIRAGDIVFRVNDVKGDGAALSSELGSAAEDLKIAVLRLNCGTNLFEEAPASSPALASLHATPQMPELAKSYQAQRDELLLQQRLQREILFQQWLTRWQSEAARQHLGDQLPLPAFCQPPPLGRAGEGQGQLRAGAPAEVPQHLEDQLSLPAFCQTPQQGRAGEGQGQLGHAAGTGVPAELPSWWADALGGTCPRQSGGPPAARGACATGPQRGSFEAHVVRPWAACLGIDVSEAVVQGHNVFLIRRVDTGRLVDQWNKTNREDRAIQSGDAIQSVNCISGDLDLMMLELRSRRDLHLRVLPGLGRRE